MSGNNKLTRILNAIGVKTHTPLGQGSESWVFALDNDQVARISKGGARRNQVENRTALLEELGQSSNKIPFAIPQVFDTREIDGVVITIERRLPGKPMIEMLATLNGELRADLIRAYLEAAAQIGDFSIQRPWYGDLMSTNAVRSRSYHDYLARRVAHSLKSAGPEFQKVDPHQLAVALPAPKEKALVHLDAFPGNMLAEGTTITAVLDFGPSCLIGDRRLDPLTSAIYLDPAITPTATKVDLATAGEWLLDRGLAQYFAAAQNWLAAYWSFATDDINLYDWCRKILVDSYR